MMPAMGISARRLHQPELPKSWHRCTSTANHVYANSTGKVRDTMLEKTVAPIPIDNKFLCRLWGFLSLSPSSLQKLMNDNKSCRPVASRENVTETLALGIRPNQRQFRQSIQFCVGFFSPGVNQLFGHDAAPLFQSALQGSQLCLGEAVRVF